MKKVHEKILFQGKWLALLETTFINAHEQEVTWESVTRNHSPVGTVVIPILIPSKRYVLIKQYRPALEGYILGFPAGLSHDNEDVAMKELKEETGYTGHVVHQSPLLKTSSGILNDNGRVTVAYIDEEDPQNQNPQQALEAEEDIQVILLAKDDAREFLLKENIKGTYIGSNVWYVFGLTDYLV
ncbi:MAG: NUDIX hydrolase [Candidatus Omnitrophica bacterium]|nr:NUDIX hydrolase [Candidatus Omnitrophota bacterium]